MSATGVQLMGPPQPRTRTRQKAEDIGSTSEEAVEELEDMDDRTNLDEELQRQADEQFIEKLMEKNKQIERLLDELRDVEIINLELTNQCKKLKLELKTATNDLQISCNQMEMFGKQMEELKQLNEDFVAEKQYLTEEIEGLKQKLSRYETGGESVIDKYVDNVQDLQQLIRQKDEEIIKLRSSQLVPDQSLRDLHKQTNKELEEKNKQIELLKAQLNEAVLDMEQQTEIIKKLYGQSRNDIETSKLTQEVHSLSSQLKSVEEEALAKDQELLALRKRINTYERGEYGLKDALKEVNDLTKHLMNRDQRIEDMIQQINELKLQLNAAEDAIEGLEPAEKRLKTRGEDTKGNKRDKIRILEMERRILELEDQKIALTERLRLSLNKSFVDKQEEYKEINDLKARLALVETENQELQLGMKEILNGIRETDSQSDVIIECPALDRLCRLLESRSIGGDLTNVIALKAELDLVRGHNDQLRADIRQIRSDYMKVIAQYTQDLLESDIPSDETIGGESKANDYQNIIISQMTAKESDGSDERRKGLAMISVAVETDRQMQTIADEEQEQELSSVAEIQSVLISKETQTLVVADWLQKIGTDSPKVVETTNVLTQTEPKIDAKEFDIKSKNLCENCPKLMKIIDFLKNCVEKLELNIRSSESKYLQRLELLQKENKNIIENLRDKLTEKDFLLGEREVRITQLQNMLTTTETPIGAQTTDRPEIGSEMAIIEHSSLRSKSPPPLSSSCKSVLESVVNCLQARLEHKDESLRQYRNMLSEAKQNFQNEMIRLIESNRQNTELPINLTQMIDNEELESALKSCVNELEGCKTELNARIRELETELEAKTAKLIAYQNENEELKHKRITPGMQYKTVIDQLKEESKQKDSVINTLNKTIKDERAMRAVSAPKRSREGTDGSVSRDRKVDNQLFQEIANLRQVIETQKKSVTDSEVMKWNYEKSIKDIREELKNRIKEKETEILTLKEKIEKLTTRLNKSEVEKTALQQKWAKQRESQTQSKSCANKTVQTVVETSDQQSIKTKNELKRSQKEFKQRELEINKLRKDLEISRQMESELKTLLEESLKREKLATIQEESTEVDKQCEQLLQENARIKVELRMAEFELKKRVVGRQD